MYSIMSQFQLLVILCSLKVFVHAFANANIKSISNQLVPNTINQSVKKSLAIDGSISNAVVAFSSLFNRNTSKTPTLKSYGPTNEIVKTINGFNQKRVGGSDILVSEIGLGTQRWVSDDFNAPDESLCYQFLDYAILGTDYGINLIDTAEQYPIPSSPSKPEGLVETVIGIIVLNSV